MGPHGPGATAAVRLPWGVGNWHADTISRYKRMIPKYLRDFPLCQTLEKWQRVGRCHSVCHSGEEEQGMALLPTPTETLTSQSIFPTQGRDAHSLSIGGRSFPLRRLSLRAIIKPRQCEPTVVGRCQRGQITPGSQSGRSTRCQRQDYFSTPPIGRSGSNT